MEAFFTINLAKRSVVSAFLTMNLAKRATSTPISNLAKSSIGVAVCLTMSLVIRSACVWRVPEMRSWAVN